MQVPHSCSILKSSSHQCMLYDGIPVSSTRDCRDCTEINVLVIFIFYIFVVAAVKQM